MKAHQRRYFVFQHIFAADKFGTPQRGCFIVVDINENRWIGPAHFTEEGAWQYANDLEEDEKAAIEVARKVRAIKEERDGRRAKVARH